MTEYDVVVRGGTVIDGTGFPRYKGDIGIKNGRVSQVTGKIKPGAAREIDASGCIVAPGAMDLHTHFEAQLNWDPYCTWNGLFGITSYALGQCGFGFAPTRPEDRDLNMRMMNRIEAIPLESMEEGMRWDWETFPEFLDSLERNPLGVNVGSLIPFSPLRGYVLGMRAARERTSVTDDELNQMKSLAYDAMKAGAFGLSGNKQNEDRCEDGSYLPSHVASEREFVELAEVVGQFPVGLIGWTIGNHSYNDDREAAERALLGMMRGSGHKGHVQNVAHQHERPGLIGMAQAEGLPLIGQRSVGQTHLDFKLADWNLWDDLPAWVEPMVGSVPERMAKLADPKHRAAMKQDHLKMGQKLEFNWDVVLVAEVAHDRNREYEGMTINELGKATGKHPIDAMLDLAIDEELQTELAVPGPPSNPKANAEAVNNPYLHHSFSDGGAHGLFHIRPHWPVTILATFSRDEGVVSLEKAHNKISAFPAWLTGFKDRGVIRPGAWADLMIYNLEELGVQYDYFKELVLVEDLPGGAKRKIQKPTGMRYVMVNGEVTFENNECTGATPGKLLRSYDMVG